MPHKRPLAERFWQKVERRGPDECWPWLGFGQAGYGKFSLGSREAGVDYAHRIAWELTFGPIPSGLHIDHLCHNQGCCNPSHLEPVTPGENTRRKNGRWMHCKRGHPFDEANTRRYRERRICRACAQFRQVRLRQRRYGAARSSGS